MMTESQKKKAGDVLCDIGKYMLTVVPFSYFLSDKPAAVWIVIGTAFFGVLFILFGLYFVKHAESKSVLGKGKKKKFKLMKNAVYSVEEITS